LEGGQLLLVWSTGLDVFLQRFDAAGKPVTAPALVNTYTEGLQLNAVGAWGVKGDAIVAWEGPGTDDPAGIAARPLPLFGYAIGGTAWNALDRDGVRDDGAADGVEGRTIELLRDGSVLASTITDAAGRYRFLGLFAGTYTVRQVLPAGWGQSLPA